MTIKSNSSHQSGPRLQQVASYTQRCRDLPLGSQLSQLARLAASGDQQISGRPEVDLSTDGKLRKQHQHIIKISNQSFITCGFINYYLFFNYFDDTNYYQSLSINDYLLHQINIINDCHLLLLDQAQRWLQLLLAFPSMSFGRRLICKRGSRFWRSGSLVACKHCCFEPSTVETWNIHYGCAEHSDLEPLISLMALWLHYDDEGKRKCLQARRFLLALGWQSNIWMTHHSTLLVLLRSQPRQQCDLRYPPRKWHLVSAVR